MTVSAEVGQLPLLIVHTNVFAPTVRDVTPDVGSPGVVTALPPAITVKDPEPTIGVFPANVPVVEQTVWSVPAVAVVGTASRVILTVSLVVGQTPLVIIHSNMLVPTLSPVTPELGSFSVVTEPPPAITAQDPVPAVGVFASSVAVVEQTV